MPCENPTILYHFLLYIPVVYPTISVVKMWSNSKSKSRNPLQRKGLRDSHSYSHSTGVKQIRSVFVACGIHGSFEYLIYPYYTAYIVGCYHFVIGVDNRSIIIVDDIQVVWRYYTLFASAFQDEVFLRIFTLQNSFPYCIIILHALTL
jgi:hypothetical protein